MPRSVKQRWQAERIWKNRNHLKGMINRLRGMASDTSTLLDESVTLAHVCNQLFHLWKSMGTDENKEQSVALFEKHNQP